MKTINWPVPLTAFAMAGILPAHAWSQDVSGVIGLGVSSAPTSFGSDDTTTDASPLIDLRWGDGFSGVPNVALVSMR